MARTYVLSSRGRHLSDGMAIDPPDSNSEAMIIWALAKVGSPLTVLDVAFELDMDSPDEVDELQRGINKGLQSGNILVFSETQ